jgi:1-phosphofructokinase family hexose kinase
MAKIITVTANTAIDFFIEVDGLSARNNLQAKNSADFACGKGINVAKAVESLGFPAVCLGFAGRQSEHLFNGLNSKLLKLDLVAVEGKTRTNITLFDSADNRETHIRTPGFTVTHDDCRHLLDKIDIYANAGDIVIVSGSLPNGAPDCLYRTIIEHCHNKMAIPILDASAKGLAEGLIAKPYLIKPNLRELEELTGISLPDEQAIVNAARGIIDQGISWIYVSLGGKGVIAVGQNVAIKACINLPLDGAVTKIGCGDAMVAGLATAMLQKQDLENMIKSAVACGTANLFSVEPGRLDRARIAEIINHIEISEL